MRSRYDAAADGFIGMFLDIVANHPDLPAMTMLKGQELSNSITYSELNALAERIQFTLLAKGLGRGEFVLLQLPVGPWTAAAILALASMEAIFVSVNPELTGFELARIVEDCQPVGVFSAQRPPSSRGIRFVIASEKDLLDGQAPLRVPRTNPVVSCHYTYKGLGYPLGVLHRYEQYSWCLRAFSDAESLPKMKAGDRHLLGLPVHQIYGVTGGLLSALTTGGHILVSADIFEQDLPLLLERHQIQVFCAVPILLKSLGIWLRRKQVAHGPYNFHPSLFVISGGSLMSAELAAEVHELLGIHVYQGYGLTETMPFCGTGPGHDKPGSLGRPYAPYLEVAILDPEAKPLAPGATGIIGFRGPTLAPGFLNHPELTDEFFRDGWFHTGDLGSFDSDGYLWFHGRASAFTKVASQMVDLTEVESVLAGVPGVLRARVTVDIHPQLGEWLVASVEIKPGAVISNQDLKAACSQVLSTYKIPRQFKISVSPKKGD